MVLIEFRGAGPEHRGRDYAKGWGTKVGGGT